MNKRISLDFKFRCYGNSNEKNLCSKTKDYCFLTIKKSVSLIFLQNLILPAVTIKLYCFKLLFEHHFCLNNRSFVFQQWTIILILVAMATKFEMKQNSFAKF